MIPRATARLQFHRDFTLDDALPVIPYLARLGISHLYASPLLKARPGSTHGYDIVDHGALNPELGGEPALRRVVAALRAEGMGLILDIVPNHMGVGGSDNAWWLDVLEWGRASPHARAFDIDWEPPDRALRGRLLAPFLGAPYGEALLAGDLRLEIDRAAGAVAVRYFEHRFPIAPQHVSHVLRASGALPPDAAALLEPLARDFGAVGLSLRDRPRARAEAEARKAELAALAATAEGAAALDAVEAAHDPATAEGRDRLHRLLERQHYRLAWWRAAADEINWRRFFDVTSLAGLRQEDPEVFEATHALVFRLYAEGLVDGLRIDHVDGLADPRGYCRKLRRRLEALEAQRPPEAPRGSPVWIEKILAPGEPLAGDWMVEGTTGYDFMAEAAGVLHDTAGAAPLTALWTAQTGRPGDYAEETRAARRQILRDNLASELNAAALALRRVAARDLATRDFTATAIRRALAEVLAHFPVYRLYVGIAGRSEEDARILRGAIEAARATVRATERPLLELLDRWLGGDAPRSVPPAERRERLAAAVRVQQLSAPVAAKSEEDTAFYRYGRLLSRCEVGSDPGILAIPPSAFHAAAEQRAARFPQALLATATHDHKRGEDVRARLAVLAERAEEWAHAVTGWHAAAAPLRREAEGLPAPDAADEMMLWQTLVGAWPLDLDPEDGAGAAAFLQRILAWQEKALREAKRRTDWSVPNEAYEAACRDFATAILALDRMRALRDEVARFAAGLALPGALNGLAQALLRCTAPGIPDLYQGTEFWDLSLVDPDNRRPVDWAARIAALRDPVPPASLLGTWRDGRVKQAVIARALALRAEKPGLFARGAYLPLRAEGPRAGHLLAFARREGREVALVLVTRLAAPLLRRESLPLVPAETWDGTALLLPPAIAGAALRDRLDGGGVPASGARLAVGALLRDLPVALLATG